MIGDDWPGKFAPIPWVYTEIVRHLSRVEKVHIVVRGGAMKRRVADQLDAVGVNLEAVRFFKAATDRVWLRDSGPTFVVKDEPASDATDRVGLVDWKFNGWAKYDNHRRDNRLPRKLARWLGLPRWVPRVEQGGDRVRVVMEGGAIDVNGRGTLLTTEECLLGEVQARNPGLDRAALEQVFADYLGVTHVVWLGRGIDGDDTHGHVDDLARFVDPRTVVTVVEPRADDPNHEPLQDNLRRLQAARDQDGKPLRVVELPMPRPGRLRRPTAAGQLCQLLHRQRPGARSRPSTTRPTASRSIPWRASFPIARSSASTASTWSWAWGPCTACRNSSRPWPRLVCASDCPDGLSGTGMIAGDPVRWTRCWKRIRTGLTAP